MCINGLLLAAGDEVCLSIDLACTLWSKTAVQLLQDVALGARTL